MTTTPIDRLDLALSEFRGVYPDASLVTMQVFLTVAMLQGTGSRELIRKLGTSQSTVSRHQMILSTGPLGIIETIEDPRDRRSKICLLTERGRVLAAKLSEIVSPGCGQSAVDFIFDLEREGVT